MKSAVEVTMKILLTQIGLTALLTFAAMTAFAGQPAAGSGDALRYEVIEAGHGPAAQKGDVVVIHCAIWLDQGGVKGNEIIDTRKEGEPVAFKLGVDGVMPAWNPGVTGMRAGGKRRLMVPAHLGYGERGLEDAVPPGADLIVEIELLEIKD